MARMVTVLLVMAVAAGSGLSAQGSGALPGRLNEYITTVVKPTPDEYKQLLAGAPIAKLLDADETKEIAVFGAVWVNAPISAYIAAVKDIETFESGPGFRTTKRISMPPRLEDFAGMFIPDDDFADLRTCRVGNCEIKLSEEALARVRKAVDWKSPNAKAQAEVLVRQMALDYANSYLAGGNERLAVYRDSSRPTFVANEFREMVERATPIAQFLPEIHDYLLNFPKATLPGSTSFLYWQETEFGLKPTIRISHVTIHENQEGAVVASKMLYASHYFWTGLEMRVLVPDPARGQGFWFVTVNRSRSDGLTGFVGRFVRSRARSGALEGVLAALQATKHRLEPAR